MKFLLILSALALATLLFSALAFSNSEPLKKDSKNTTPYKKGVSKTIPLQNANLVTITKEQQFEPRTLKIKAGDTVTWKNDDYKPHTVTADSGKELDSGKIQPGESFSHTFPTPGDFSYHCALHPNMKGEIVVDPNPNYLQEQSADSSLVF